MKKSLEKQNPRKTPKPELADLVKDLEVAPGVERELAGVFNAGKDQVFELLKTPRADGGNFLDDFVAAVRAEDRDAKAMALWGQMMTETVPGTQETYFGKIVAIGGTMNSAVEGLVNDEQYRLYQRKGVDPHQVQTGYDPVRNYFTAQGVSWPEEWD